METMVVMVSMRLGNSASWQVANATGMILECNHSGVHILMQSCYRVCLAVLDAQACSRHATHACQALGERSAGSSTWASWLGSPFRTIGRIAHVIYNLLPIVFKCAHYGFEGLRLQGRVWA